MVPAADGVIFFLAFVCSVGLACAAQGGECEEFESSDVAVIWTAFYYFLTS